MLETEKDTQTPFIENEIASSVGEVTRTTPLSACNH